MKNNCSMTLYFPNKTLKYKGNLLKQKWTNAYRKHLTSCVFVSMMSQMTYFCLFSKLQRLRRKFSYWRTTWFVPNSATEMQVVKIWRLILCRNDPHRAPLYSGWHQSASRIRIFSPCRIFSTLADAYSFQSACFVLYLSICYFLFLFNI